MSLDHDIRALEADIHWWKSRRHERVTAPLERRAFALCRQYLGHGCRGCPVCELSGLSHCEGTPLYGHTYWWAMNDDSVTEGYRRHWWRHLVNEMKAYLREVRSRLIRRRANENAKERSRQRPA